MRRTVIFAALVLSLDLTTGCGPEVDDQKPVIDLTIEEAFPVNCDTIYLGQPFTMQLLLTDNQELGSYSVEIHHNFDHHAHSTEVEQCVLSSVKSPVNPLYFLEDYTIPAGTKEYLVSTEITLPASHGERAFDLGDYHFFIRLTDREGWSSQKGLSIKILN